MVGEDSGPGGSHAPRVPDDWFDGFQRGLAARFWRAAGATMADKDAQLVRGLLGVPPGARVLDMPCGDGRITVRLAAAGYRAIGVDLAEAELERGRRAAAEAGVEATFLAGDLRAPPAIGPVQAIVSWGNSFGYLTPAETAGSLAGLRRLLAPDGRLVLESMTVAESFLPGGVQPTAEREFGGVRMTAHIATGRQKAGSRATTSSRMRTARSNARGPPTTSTPRARSCGCWQRRASARSSSWARTAGRRTSSARRA